MTEIKIGSRKGKLAIAQAIWVKKEIERLSENIKCEIVYITTRGDRFLSSPLHKLEGTGFFTKEIENILLNREIDIAVHSMKDLPTELREELNIGAITQREAANDVLISDGRKLNELNPGAKIGTSSLRRRSQLLLLKKDINVINMRGNIDTRVKGFISKGFDGIVVAYAGIKRAGYKNMIAEIFPIDVIIPAVGQGALGLEIRKDDEYLYNIVSRLDNENARITITAERSFLKAFGGGCKTPVGAYAWIENKRLNMIGGVFSIDGNKSIVETISNDSLNPEDIGRKIADIIVKRGGLDLINQE